VSQPDVPLPTSATGEEQPDTNADLETATSFANSSQQRAAAAIPTPTAAFTMAELQEQAARSAAAAAGRMASPAPPAPSAMPPRPLPPLPKATTIPYMPPPPPFRVPPAGHLPNSPPPLQGAPSLPLPPLPSSVPPVSGSLLTTGTHTLTLRADAPREVRAASAHVVRTRAYAFVVDARGVPIEVGSGRFAKAYLGEERWLESKTDFRRDIVIKILQKGVTDDDRARFQIEKELLERVQGHPNIIALHASGESDDPEFIPAAIRDKVENDFVILERMDMSLEERLKGTRARGKRDDLLASEMKDRLFRVLDYMIPVASAIEYAHVVRNICHRDIKPANVLVGLPDTDLRGASLEVRVADFNVAKLGEDDVSFHMTSLKSVPGTLFFQSPEQETNLLELLVNVTQGSPEVEFFEDFYIQIAKNDSFSLFNRDEQYGILYSDRAKKRVVLDRPYRDPSETNVRARVQKSVGRPADIYSLGALFYYLISGAYANPKALYDAFHKFIEYEQTDQNNTIEAYLAHEYGVIESLRAPKPEGAGVHVAPADRFFTYKHYLDGNGELIDPQVMRILARCMIRNKPDSYCQAHEIETRGISLLVQDLIDLYSLYGFRPGSGSTQLARRGHSGIRAAGFGQRLSLLGVRFKRWWGRILRAFSKSP
jgi:serine/threonine protein kinase